MSRQLPPGRINSGQHNWKLCSLGNGQWAVTGVKRDARRISTSGQSSRAPLPPDHHASLCAIRWIVLYLGCNDTLLSWKIQRPHSFFMLDSDFTDAK